MAILLLIDGEDGTIRPGDAVFDYLEGAEFPVHAGISVGKKRRHSRSAGRLEVCGIPGHPNSSQLDSADWGAPDQYRAAVVGQRLDTNAAAVKQVALLCLAVLTEHTQLATRCSWSTRLRIDENHRILDGIPLFERGTCSQFVEYLYEYSGLDLIQQDKTHNPEHPDRIYPACQIYVFWSGRYSLRSSWDKDYERFRDCLKGRRSHKR
jgi:hypothetical protein